jgi:preprotein translocase subunit YajC
MLTVLLAQAPQPQEMPFWANPIFMIAMMVLFWVVIVLPMSRRQKKEQADMLASIARGAKVLTSGGIIGTVVKATDGEDEIVVRSEDSKFKMLRSSIVRVLGKDESEAGK